MLSSSPFPRHRPLQRPPAQTPGDAPRLHACTGPRKIARQTLRSRLLAAHPSDARRRELLGDMREPPVRARIETHDAGEHIRWHTSLNARRQGALEAHAQAELDAVFDAAAALLDAGPERARPSLWREEKDKASSTTSKSPISIKAAAIMDCSCPRAAACIAPACPYHVRPPHARAVAQRRRQRHPLPRAGHRPSGEAVSHHLARTCHQSLVFDIISPARFFLPPQQRSTELIRTECH